MSRAYYVLLIMSIILKWVKALLTQSKNNVHSVTDILLTGTVMRNVVSLQLLALYNQYLLSYITRKEEDIIICNDYRIYTPFNFGYPYS